MEQVSIYIQIWIGIILLIAGYLDIRYRKIPIKLIFIALIGVLSLMLITKEWNLIRISTGIGIGGFLLAVNKLTNGQIGIGDGILFCITGLALGGGNNLLLLFWSLVITCIIAIILLMIKKVSSGQELPFIPFVLVSYIGIMLL